MNDPSDLGVNRRLENLEQLQAKARTANHRLLETERADQNTVLESPAFARISQPTVEDGGQRAPALRFGDPRVMGLASGLASTVHTITGTFTNKSLRAVVNTLSTIEYTSARMSYDLRRLRLKGLVHRVPGTNAYRITPDRLRFAVFYIKVHNRLLTPLLAANQPPAPPEVRHAFEILTHHTNRSITLARLQAA